MVVLIIGLGPMLGIDSSTYSFGTAAHVGSIWQRIGGARSNYHGLITTIQHSTRKSTPLSSIIELSRRVILIEQTDQYLRQYRRARPTMPRNDWIDARVQYA